MEESFWSKVDVQGPDDCWNWIAGCFNSGYGCFDHKPAHRTAWTLMNGPIPKGMLILHHCDNKLCMNPKHLYVGTAQDNVDDMYRRGRARSPGARGERNSNAKLTEDEVRKALKMHADGVLQVDIAAYLDVDNATIYNIIRRRSWKHVHV